MGEFRRRDFVIASAALLAPLRVFGQEKAKQRTYRIALLDETSESGLREAWTAFRTRLRALGYVEGRNLHFDERHAGGDPERLSGLAKEIAALKPDVIACSGTPATRAAIRATSRIPIVFIGAGDPVATGLVANLAHPDRNVTGISSITTETGQKSLELLLELVPGAQRVAYLGDPSNQLSSAVYYRVEEQARKKKILIQMLDASNREALAQTFQVVRRERIQAILVGSASASVDFRNDITQFAAQEKLPAVYGRTEYASTGGLLVFGIDRTAAAWRGADLVHRILNGAKPSDLAVEQVASLRMVVNLKTARALGITVPQALLTRADEVIE